MEVIIQGQDLDTGDARRLPREGQGSRLRKTLVVATVYFLVDGYVCKLLEASRDLKIMIYYLRNAAQTVSKSGFLLENLNLDVWSVKRLKNR